MPITRESRIVVVNPCPTCRDYKKVPGSTGGQVDCVECEGTGEIIEQVPVNQLLLAISEPLRNAIANSITLQRRAVQ